MKRSRKRVAMGAVVVGVVALSVPLYFTVRALARAHPEVTRGTAHASLSRESCIACHAPIAAEWRESFHFRSVTGPFWNRVRTKGYASLFKLLRVPCMNCHAPANVLGLAAGMSPVERSDAVEMGVDCLVCHLSEQGITGPGRSREAPHEVIRDERFGDPVRTSVTLCASCHEEPAEHAKTVTAWQRTHFARDGVTCLHCHMPDVVAPVIADGPARPRRSHRFPGDKHAEMLQHAVNASLLLTDNHAAVVRITNDRVGHALPASGMNSLIVRVTTRAEDGRVINEMERAFGSKEWIPGYLDFWPFQEVTKIPAGDCRDIVVPVPRGHGQVSAEFRYRDWWTITDQDLVIGTLAQDY